MYTVADYGSMIADAVRMRAYEEALRRTVRAGDVVVDVGTGTAIFALLACRLGAGKVYAIDPNPAIEVGRECAKRNGFADRITFFEARSSAVELPERADVMVSDMRGSMPLHGVHVSAIIDARERFLKRDGAQIPISDALFAAPVETPALYDELVGVWSRPDLNLTACREAVLNDLQSETNASPIRAEQLVAPAACWATIDYRTVTSPDVSGKLAFVATRDATIHGIAGWFEATVAQGISYDNGPGSGLRAYSRVLFPLQRPAPVRRGEAILFDVRAVAAKDSYVFSWATRVGGNPPDRQSSAWLLSLPGFRMNRPDC